MVDFYFSHMWSENRFYVTLILWNVLRLPLGSNRRRQWHPTPVLLPGKSHGWRSLVGCSPWGRKESDTTEQLHFHFSLPCLGEGNGNPLQCSCLENPRDGKPGGLPSMGSHSVGHGWSDLAAAAAAERDTRTLWLTQRGPPNSGTIEPLTYIFMNPGLKITA